MELPPSRSPLWEESPLERAPSGKSLQKSPHFLTRKNLIKSFKTNLRLRTLRHNADLVRIDLELSTKHICEADAERDLMLRDRIALAIEHRLAISIGLELRLADLLLLADELSDMTLELTGKDQDRLAWLELRCLHLIGIFRFGQSAEGSHLGIWDRLRTMTNFIAHKADDIFLILTIEQRLAAIDRAMNEDDARDDDLLLPDHAVRELDADALHGDIAFHEHLGRVDLNEQVFFLSLATTYAFPLYLDAHEVVMQLQFVLGMHIAGVPVDRTIEFEFLSLYLYMLVIAVCE